MMPEILTRLRRLVHPYLYLGEFTYKQPGIESAFFNGHPNLLSLALNPGWLILIFFAQSSRHIVVPLNVKYLFCALFLYCSLRVAHLQFDGL